VGSATTPWRFELATLKGVGLGELTGINNRKLTFQLNRPTTFEGTMDVHHPLMATMMNQANQHLLVKAYKRGTLMAQVEIASGELKGDATSHTIQLNGTCTAYARIKDRHIGKSAAGVTYTNFDRTQIVASALAEINAEKDSKVRMGAGSSTSIVTAGPFRYKPFLQLVNELSNTITGFDHWITLAEPNIDPNGAYGYLNVSALRGTLRENAVLEYGTGRRNAREYGLQWDTSFRITRGLALPPSFPDNANLEVVSRTAVDYAAIEDTEGAGMREAIIEGDLVDTGLRQLLVDEHLSVRRYPRQLFVIHPHIYTGDTKVPDFGFDYDIGDMIEGRVDDSGLVMLNAIVRVYKAECAINDEGVESVTLTTVDEATTGS